MIIAGSENKARDCGKAAVRVIVRQLPDGRTVNERIPWQPFLPCVDPAGFVVNIPLHNGGANDGPEEPHRLYVERRARRNGFVRVDVCPQTEGHEVRKHLPQSILGRQPCRTTTTGKPAMPSGRFPYGHYCKCIEDLIAQRTEAHEKVERSRKSGIEMLTERQRQSAERQLEVNSRLVDVLEKVERNLDSKASPAPAPSAPTNAPRGKGRDE